MIWIEIINERRFSTCFTCRTAVAGERAFSCLYVYRAELIHHFPDDVVEAVGSFWVPLEAADDVAGFLVRKYLRQVVSKSGLVGVQLATISSPAGTEQWKLDAGPTRWVPTVQDITATASASATKAGLTRRAVLRTRARRSKGKPCVSWWSVCTPVSREP